MDELDGLVDEILGEVVSLIGGLRRIDAMVVVSEIRVELVRLAVEEAVETIEPALQGPRVVRAGGGGLIHGTQMPLAKGEGGIALVAQHLGHGGGMRGDLARHMRIAGVPVGDTAHADGVMVPTGEQRRTSGRAQRRDMEVRVTQTTCSETIDVRGDEIGTEAVEM